VAAPVTTPTIQPETVEALVANVRGLIDDEGQRTSSLMLRASGLAGFAGVILALAGAAARPARGLEGALEAVVAALSVLGLLSLALAVITVVLGVLVPRHGVTVATAEVRTYPTNAVTSRDRVTIQGRFLRGLVRSLERERSRDQSGARALRIGYTLLCLGLMLVTAASVTLVASGHFYD